MQTLRWLRIAVFLVFSLKVAAFADSLVVLTWNLHNFPSGHYSLRKPEIEGHRTSAVANSIRQYRPEILLLQEVRDSLSCLRLLDSIGDTTYKLLKCSSFRDNSGIATFQQLAIISRLPSTYAIEKKWFSFGIIDPPRGFIAAIVQSEAGRILFCNIHLKSNMTSSANVDKSIQLNILKRELAIEQLLKFASADSTITAFSITAVVIGGDFNTNTDNVLFISEHTLPMLTDSGYHNCFNGIPLERRITWNANGQYADATFDYIFVKGMNFTKPVLTIHSDFSDHQGVLCTIGHSLTMRSTNK
jgi:endonuclease/exonuclease/phosphatase family metal-dependent hydrolase